MSSKRVHIEDEFRVALMKLLERGSINQTQLAEKLGRNKSWITKITNGSANSIAKEDYEKLQSIFNTTKEVIKPIKKDHHPNILLLSDACGDDERKLQLVKLLAEILGE